MKKNMGSADKTIRVLIAAVVAGLYYKEIVSGTLGIVLLVAIPTLYIVFSTQKKTPLIQGEFRS